MPRTCTICSHPDRIAIEQALLGKVPLRDVARQCRVSKDALSRHTPHISPAAVEKHEAAEATRTLSLGEQVAQLQADAHRIGAAAEKEGDKRTALMAIRELVRIADLLARMQGAVREPAGSTVNVVVQYVDKALVLPAASPRLLTDGE